MRQKIIDYCRLAFLFVIVLSTTVSAYANDKSENKVRITNETITVNLGDNGEEVLSSGDKRWLKEFDEGVMKFLSVNYK